MSYPRKGSVVHYWTHRLANGGDSELVSYAAIVTDVRSDGTVDLTAFPPGATPVVFQEVAHGTEPKYGRWTRSEAP